jgi:hypothetical protein
MTPAALTPAARRRGRARSEDPIPRRVSGPLGGKAAAAPRDAVARRPAAPRSAPASRATAASRSASAARATGPSGRASASRATGASRAAVAAAVALPRPVRAPRPRAVPDPSPRRREPPRPRRIGIGRARPQALITAPFWQRALAILRRLPDHPLLDRIVRGRAWIALLGVMLVGIVAMQVEVLKYGASIGRALENTSILQSRNELLRAQVSALSSDQRIERDATRMGLTMATPESYTFLKATPAQIGRALASIRPPSSSFRPPAQTSATGG